MTQKIMPEIIMLEDLERLGDVSPVLSSIFPAVAKRFNEDYQFVSDEDASRWGGKIVDLSDFRERACQKVVQAKKLEEIEQLKEIFEIGRNLQYYQQMSDIVSDYVYLCSVVNEELHKRPPFQHLWVQ